MSSKTNSSKDQSLLLRIYRILFPNIRRAVFFSIFVNILVLSPSWYMLEVYDRVVNSQNLYTLGMLTVFVLFSYAVLEVLEYVRNAIFQEGACRVDEAFREALFANILKAKLMQLPGGSNQPLADLKTIQNAITSPALTSMIDVPFALFALILIFSIDVSLGWFAVGGAILLGMIAWINDQRVHPPLAEAHQYSTAAQNYFNGVIYNIQVIKAMGMLGSIYKIWGQKYQKYLSLQAQASDSAGVNASLSKLIQTIQGSLILGFACWLVLQGKIPVQGSYMIVASILGGRMLAPLVQLIAHWRVVVNARDAIERLDKFIASIPAIPEKMTLPPPKGDLSVEGIVVAAPNSRSQILKGISFNLAAGRSLAIIGPSASGKTTLTKVIAGIWPAIAGKVRLDGADIYSWDKKEIGPHVGYLPQTVDLFEGTLAENISRFGKLDMMKVEEATRIVGLTSTVEALEDGYDTQLGAEGEAFSGGQKQRIALARAVYGLPNFVVLDEPNSSLDQAGDLALTNAINLLKARGTTIVVVTHRETLLNQMDEIMVLVDGQVKMHGPRDEVIEALKAKQDPKPKSPDNERAQ